MIKGCQRRIVLLRTTDSKYFEEAYFILRDSTAEGTRNSDIIREAERIAGMSLPTAPKKRTRFNAKKLLPALIGAAGASFIFGMALLLASLLA